MTEDDSNRTLLDFESSTDGDAARDGDDARGDEGAAEVDEGAAGVEEETVGAGEGAAVADGDDESGDDDSGDDDAVTVRDPGSVSPAVSTSRFAPDGESCASCGASTRRLWVAEGDVVCVDCKAW